MSERMKQQIRVAADFLIRLLTVPEEQDQDHEDPQTDDAEPGGDASDAQHDHRP